MVVLVDGEPDYILVVEDDREIQETIAMLLADYGHDVRTASNGRDALKLLNSGAPPRLILLDLMMPVMSGEQLIEHLAATPAMADLPVCVLTASHRPVRRAGVVAVLRKPFDEAALMAVVDRYSRS